MAAASPWEAKGRARGSVRAGRGLRPSAQGRQRALEARRGPGGDGRKRLARVLARVARNLEHLEHLEHLEQLDP